MGYFTIQDREAECAALAGEADSDPLTAFGSLLIAIGKSWDIEHDNAFIHAQLAEAFHDLCNKANDSDDGWEQDLFTDQVFDMDFSGVMLRWFYTEN